MIREFEMRNKDKLPIPKDVDSDKNNTKLSSTINKKHELRRSSRKAACIRVDDMKT